jgi:hypothetical protein
MSQLVPRDKDASEQKPINTNYSTAIQTVQSEMMKAFVKRTVSCKKIEHDT